MNSRKNTSKKAVLIGYGTMGRRHRQRMELLGVDFIGVADSSAETSSLPFADADFAVIASPATTHYEYVKLCLQKKLPVFVEKPLATTAADAEELVQMALSKNVPLFVGHSESFNSSFSKFLTDLTQFAKNSSCLSLEFKRTHGFSERCRDVNVALDLMVHDLQLFHEILVCLDAPLQLRHYKMDNREFCKDRVQSCLSMEMSDRTLEASFVADRNCSRSCRTISVKDQDGNSLLLDLAPTESQNPDALSMEYEAFFEGIENASWKKRLNSALFAVDAACLFINLNGK